MNALPPSPAVVAQVIVGTSLAFLGVVLITLGSASSWGGLVRLAAALSVTITGLGLLLRVVARYGSQGRDNAPDP